MAEEVSNVFFRCRTAHSSSSLGGFTQPVTEKGVSGSTTRGINVSAGGGARPPRGGPMTKPDVRACALPVLFFSSEQFLTRIEATPLQVQVEVG